MPHTAVLPRLPIAGGNPFLREHVGDPGQAQALAAQGLNPGGRRVWIVGPEKLRRRGVVRWLPFWLPLAATGYRSR